MARNVGPFVQIVASATMVVRDRRILLDRELELDHGRIGELALELPELLLRIGPNRVADLDVLAFDLQGASRFPLSQGRQLAP